MRVPVGQAFPADGVVIDGHTRADELLLSGEREAVAKPCGAAVVVVAAIGTAVVAYRGADEVLVDTRSARHAPVRPTPQTPAIAARNHAATAAAVP